MRVKVGQFYLSNDKDYEPGRTVRVTGKAKGQRRWWVENVKTSRKVEIQGKILQATDQRGWTLLDWEQAPCPRCNDPGVLGDEGVSCGYEHCRCFELGPYQHPPGCLCDDEPCEDARDVG